LALGLSPPPVARMVLRLFLRSWLQNAAREKIRRQVSEAACRETAGAGVPEDQQSHEPAPCQVGVVFALGIEAGGLEDRLQGGASTRAHGFVVRQGHLNGRRVVLFRSGAGRRRAANVTELLIETHQPQWVLSAGFAGGLTDKLKRHEILMVDDLVDIDGGHLTIDLKVDPDVLSGSSGVHVGRLLTADRVIRLPHQKRSLGEEHGALAVDMESFAVAEVCRSRKVRFLAIRVINDTVDEELPPDVGRLLAQQTHAARLGAAVGAIWNRPSSLKDLLRLKENALLASDHLARFLAGVIKQLAPPPSSLQKPPM